MRLLCVQVHAPTPCGAALCSHALQAPTTHFGQARVFTVNPFHLHQYNHDAFSTPEQGFREACLPFFYPVGTHDDKNFVVCFADFSLRAIMSPLSPPRHTSEIGEDPSLDDHAARVLRQFRLIFNTVRRHFQTMEKQSGIGGAQVWALSLVAQHQGLGVTQLAALMDIHQSTTSNLVRSLIKSGLLHSEKSASDRRVVELYVLPEGVKLLKKIPGPFAGVLPHALQRMDEVTLLQLEHNLSALINRLEVDEKAAQTPIAMM